MSKYTVCVDFDGVLHSYPSPWVNAHTIPDAPVAGALEWLVSMLGKFDVAILSTRNKTWLGRRAMRKWLAKHLIASAGIDFDSTPEWWADRIAQTAFADPWEYEVYWAAWKVAKEIQFPKYKPAALIYLDDRAVRFTGPDSWPTRDQIHLARPWNKP